MKNILNYTLLLIAAFVLFSCGGSTGELMGLPPQQSVTPVMKQLKKLTIQETGVPSYDLNYLYSNSILSQITSSDNSYNYAFEYSGNQMTKMTRIYNLGGAVEVMTSNFVYSNGLVSQITGNIAQAGTVSTAFTTNVSYTAGKVTQVKTQTFMPGSTVALGTIITDIEYTGNNVSKTTYSESAPGMPANTVVITYSNFDVNPNPFRTLPVEFTIASTNWELDIDAPIGFSSNNAKTVTTSGNAENVSYSYDAAGYPTQASAPSTVLKFEYY